MRVHDLVPQAEWSKRYAQINAFEREVIASGTRIVKVMTHISKDEQKARLTERLERPDKHWKYNPGDVDERLHWDDYMEAYQVALTRTSTKGAPWYVVPADRSGTRGGRPAAAPRRADRHGPHVAGHGLRRRRRAEAARRELMEFPEPTNLRDDRREVLLEYLDYYRWTVREKVTGLDEAALRTSRLASGWTPIELVKHLVNVERRWIVWGFEGVDLPDPWADARNDRWYAGPDERVEDLLDAFDAGGRHTREVVMAHDLADLGAPSDRWDDDRPPPLERVLLHLVQEYARHAGHLDIVRELADGATGE